MPYTLTIVIILQVVATHSVPLPVHPRPNVSTSVSPSKYTPTVLSIAVVFPFIAASIRPFVHSFSVNHIVLPLPPKNPTIRPEKLPLSIHLIFNPRPNVTALIFPNKLTIPIFFSSPEFSFKDITIRPFINTMAELYSPYPFTSVLGAIRVNKYSFSVRPIIHKLSFVVISIGIVKFAKTICLAFQPLPIIL